MSASFYNLLKYAATGIASPDMTYFDKMRASTLMGGAVQTLTGIPPLSFKAYGKPLISWSMLGNWQKTGTPTPDAPIMPEFVGVRTGNLFDIEKWLSDNNVPFTKSDGSYTFSTSSELFNNPCYFSTADMTVTISITITVGTARAVRLDTLHADGSIREYSSITEETSTRMLSGVAGIRLNWTNSGTTTLSFCMINAGITALPYEPFGWAEKITCAGQTVPVYLGQTQTVRKIKKLVLTGEETIRRDTDSGRSARYYIAISDIESDTTNLLSSHFTVSMWYEFGTMKTYGKNLIFAMDKSQYPEIADFKYYLASEYNAGTPVIVWYVLATPTTGIVNEPLAKIGDYADELHSTDAGVTIPTVRGSNTLTVDTTLQPSAMSVTGHIKPS